ncbi:uncharacterized protein EI97DRAFT_442468 [Westerdykella ornata]|uniref:Uncharacterized protein n=1 Tax=Westerdykella ornata TaxID=318751 RepID=A0A6A6JIY3_WESOR|nr:uncharacterized protein EI97DRAFT_442468 [Westerdykella ornata]KAF2276541.1 hypothetical protein EI97DRAFT_442468 [Westerdykella ornata]
MPVSFAHAHPPQRMAEQHRHEAIEELLHRLDIGLELAGLSGKATFTDVYLPMVRRSHLTGKARTEYNFKIALESLILDQIVDQFEDWLRQENEIVAKWTITSLLGCFLSAKVVRRFDVDMCELIEAMANVYFVDNLRTCAETFTWFSSSAYGLQTMLYNFLRTRDCFCHTFPFPSVEIRFDFPATDSLCIVGEVMWQPPPVYFDDIPSALHAGAEYRITCSLRQLDFEDRLGLPNFPITYIYSVSASEYLPLAWDADKGCFRGIVPTSRDLPVKTTVTASVTSFFPGNVRFEAIARYVLVLDVLPKASPHSD